MKPSSKDFTLEGIHDNPFSSIGYNQGKICVFGATGRLGREIVRELLVWNQKQKHFVQKRKQEEEKLKQRNAEKQKEDTLPKATGIAYGGEDALVEGEVDGHLSDFFDIIDEGIDQNPTTNFEKKALVMTHEHNKDSFHSDRSTMPLVIRLVARSKEKASEIVKTVNPIELKKRVIQSKRKRMRSQINMCQAEITSSQKELTLCKQECKGKRGAFLEKLSNRLELLQKKILDERQARFGRMVDNVKQTRLQDLSLFSKNWELHQFYNNPDSSIYDNGRLDNMITISLQPLLNLEYLRNNCGVRAVQLKWMGNPVKFDKTPVMLNIDARLSFPDYEQLNINDLNFKHEENFQLSFHLEDDTLNNQMSSESPQIITLSASKADLYHYVMEKKMRVEKQASRFDTPKKRYVTFRILKGIRFEKADKFGTLNAFCKISYNGNVVGETTIQRLQLVPKWDKEVFSIGVQARQFANDLWNPLELTNENAELLIEVFDKDYLTDENDFIGQISLKGKELLTQPDEEPMYFDLVKKKQKTIRQRFTRGTLALSFHIEERGYLDPKLEVEPLNITPKSRHFFSFSSSSFFSRIPEFSLQFKLEKLSVKARDFIPSSKYVETQIWLQFGVIESPSAVAFSIEWCGKPIGCVERNDPPKFFEITVVDYVTHSLHDQFLTLTWKKSVVESSQETQEKTASRPKFFRRFSDFLNTNVSQLKQNQSIVIPGNVLRYHTAIPSLHSTSKGNIHLGVHKTKESVTLAQTLISEFESRRKEDEQVQKMKILNSHDSAHFDRQWKIKLETIQESIGTAMKNETLFNKYLSEFNDEEMAVEKESLLSDVEIVVASFDDPASIAAACDGATHIIFCASCYGFDGSNTTFATDFVGLQSLLKHIESELVVKEEESLTDDIIIDLKKKRGIEARAFAFEEMVKLPRITTRAAIDLAAKGKDMANHKIQAPEVEKYQNLRKNNIPLFKKFMLVSYFDAKSTRLQNCPHLYSRTYVKWKADAENLVRRSGVQSSVIVRSPPLASDEKEISVDRSSVTRKELAIILLEALALYDVKNPKTFNLQVIKDFDKTSLESSNHVWKRTFSSDFLALKEEA
eukprot:g3535.t1